MATYVNDLRLTELATGEGSGTWGTTTNVSLELIGEALGYATQQVFGSDADATTTIADGASDPARAMYFKITSAGSLTATRTCTIAPNTVSRVMFIENATTGSQSISISQGSGANVTILTGKTAVVYLDGAGSGAAVIDAMAGVDPGVTDTLAEVLSAGNTTTTDQKIQFRDSAIYINSSADGQLDIVADNEVQIAATTIDINGAINASGEIIAASLDISGNIDVDGTTNLDVVDIDGAVDFASTTAHAGNATFADNAKAIFGTGGDGLEIYHDGSHSYISDTGTGYLRILASDYLQLMSSSSEVYINAAANGEVTLYHDNSGKLSTSATGIQVTGNIANASGNMTLDAAGEIKLDTVGGIVRILETGGEYGMLQISNSDFIIRSMVSDKDLIFKGNDSGSVITALTLDFSDGGRANFNNDIGLLDGKSVRFGTDNDSAIFHSGSAMTVANSTGDLTLDVAGDIVLDADGAQVRFKDAGTEFFKVSNESGFVELQSPVADSDIKFNGIDGSSLITALSLDMSAAGAAIFNSSIDAGAGLRFSTDGSNNGVITTLGQDKDLYFSGDDGGAGINALVLDMSAAGAATFNSSLTCGFLLKMGEGTSSQTVGLVVDHGSSTGYNLIQLENDNGTWFSVAGSGVATFNGNLDVNGASNFNEGGADVDFRVESDSNTHMLFVDAGSNEVGIGTSDPRSPLHVSTTHTVTDVTSANTNSTLSIGNTGAGNGVYNAIKFSGNQQDMYIMSFNNATQADRRLGFFVGSTAGDAAADERLSITGDGNVLVGKTAADFSVDGVALQPSGVVGITRDGGVPLILNRKTSDGDIVNFQKSGAVVGSIGTYSGDLTIGDDDVGIRFDTGTGLVPWDLGATTTGGSATNGTIDLGVSGAAFKDLYLSGNANVGDRLLVNGATSNAQLSVKGDASLRAQNVQVAVDGHTAIGFFNTAGTDVGGIAIGTNGASISLGGNSASNTLDDYEEGTWTPTFRDLNGNLATLSTALGSYTKIGRQVILNFNLTLSSKGSMTGDFCLMSNLPFSHPNNSYNGTGHIDKFTNLDTAVSGLSFDISSTTTLMWLMGVAAAGSGSSQYISTSYIGGNEQFKGTCIYYTDD